MNLRYCKNLVFIHLEGANYRARDGVLEEEGFYENHTRRFGITKIEKTQKAQLRVSFRNREFKEGTVFLPCQKMLLFASLFTVKVAV